MKFGLHYQLPHAPHETTVERYRTSLDQAVYGETLGFESVWPVEQHFNAEFSLLPSPLLWLAALAERTRTMRLGIGIILLPLSHPALATIAIFTFMSQWNSFLEPLIFLNSSKKYTLALGLAMFRDQFDVDWNAIMAMSFLMVLPCLTIFFLAQKYFIQGISTTGLKG